MARIEKTVFISYRRKDISWALAVYQYLTSQKYDVFFDFSSLSSGDFEQVIVSNIKARAHFVLILTPTALDRCNEPGDWLRREIEIAVDEKRNIIPLFFDGFSFGSPSVAEKLTGKLGTIKRYNGLDIPSGYFMEGMERLRGRYLNVPLDAVIHPVSTEVRKVVKEEQVAADKALLQKREDIKDLVKPAEEIPKRVYDSKSTETSVGHAEKINEKPGERFPMEQNSPVVRNAKGEKTKSFWTTLPGKLTGTAALITAIAGCVTAITSLQNFLPVTPTPAAATNTIVTQTPPLITPIAPSATSETLGSPIISPKDGMTLVYVPEGEFTMGSVIGKSDEKPVHTVYLDAFWVDKTEVTNSMYSICVNDGECNGPSNTTYYDDSNFSSHPVVYVSWDDANNYCSWADRRLPTEAEWEKAARWDQENQIKHVYPWGDDIDCSFANYYDGSKQCVGTTTAVGNYPKGASPYGALDMAGNVWEWVADWYDSSYYNKSASSNPLGPNTGQYRVLRGGSWYLNDDDVRSAHRKWSYPTGSSSAFGFRCARSE